MTRFLPFIWAGLWRKPARTILTLLSVIVGFTLFGLMAGLNAAFTYVVDQEPGMQYVWPEFSSLPPNRSPAANLPVAMALGRT